ncbi:MAG TPA: FHA domain-containing protein, partial [Kiritimatiellia bacterium]|nr:FHA domain-containing protein [Kiritimatiellia bacterium]
MVRQALTTVGSDPDCHLVLTDAPALAPRHAQFKESSAGVFLSALTPEAAILRNGAPLTDTVRLVHDDQLDLGGLLIQFQEIIAPHTRLEPSPGLIQPITLLLAIVILVEEAVMLGFMFDWRTRLITPDAEARDLAPDPLAGDHFAA